jgi:hypothetical protein
MTKRSLRHLVPGCKAAALAPFVLLFGWMSGTLLRDGWRWMFGDRFVAGIVAWCAGLAVAVLAVLVALEINAAYLRWRKAQGDEDRRRCAIPACDAVLRRPYARQEGLGNICMECVRRFDRANADLPPVARAREAGL